MPTHIRTLVCALCLGLSLLVVGCTSDSNQGPPEPKTQLVEPRDALSEELMALLGQAKNFHHKADVYETDGKLEEAIGEVRHILDLPFSADYPESEDVLLDTYARLASLHLRVERLDDAMSYVNQGLAKKSRDSFFLANLHTVKGQVLQAQAELAEAEDEQRALKRQAIESFDQSIQINQRILELIKAESEAMEGGAP